MVCFHDVLMNTFCIIKRKFKPIWSTIPPISTKQTINSHLNSLNIKKTQRTTLKIQVLALDRHKDVAGFNQLMGSQLLPLV